MLPKADFVVPPEDPDSDDPPLPPVGQLDSHGRVVKQKEPCTPRSTARAKKNKMVPRSPTQWLEEDSEPLTPPEVGPRTQLQSLLPVGFTDSDESDWEPHWVKEAKKAVVVHADAGWVGEPSASTRAREAAAV